MTVSSFLFAAVCGYMCQLSALNLRDLKSTACQITYKTIYDDLVHKEVLHRQHLYNMKSAERKTYEETIQQYFHDCVPADSTLDRIERNQPVVEINWP